MEKFKVGNRQLLLDIEIESQRELRLLIQQMKSEFNDVIELIEPTLVYEIIKFMDVPLKL